MLFAFLKGVIATGLLVVAKSGFFSWFSTHFPEVLSASTVDVANSYSYYSGTLLSGLLLTFDYMRVARQSAVLKSQLSGFLAHYKSLFLQTLSFELGMQLPHINVRIFIYRRLKKHFKILNIDGLAEVGMAADLAFKVSPSQGLVGHCYNTKQMIYEHDLHNATNRLPLSRDLRNRTADLRFCLCVPIFNQEDDVVAVVAFDSSSPLDFRDKVNDVVNLFISFSQNLQKAMPDLFKPRPL